jgi:endonuclease/exonuclease/phosphatase family metal-dependent hydrolase
MQEMHESGVSAVAQALGYNYVYYPASVASHGDNFGNAILARWPINDPTKIILPGLHPLTGQQRTATRATVRIGGEDVVVYSIHAETATAPRSLRRAQFAAIVNDIPADAQRVIIGGDFNTVTGRGVNQLAQLFDAGELEHASAKLGPTFTRFGLRPSATDHIFYRGFKRRDAGVLGHIAASDHFPVWAAFTTP